MKSGLQRGSEDAGGHAVAEELIRRIQDQLQRLGARAQADQVESELAGSTLRDAPQWTAIKGRATAEGTRRFAAASNVPLVDFYREAEGLLLSSIGIGTNRGAVDDSTDLRYAHSIEAALCGGVNVIDTAISYRHQRSERAVAMGLRRFLDGDHGARDALLVCTKGGFVVPGAVPAGRWDEKVFVGGMHSVDPAFLSDQIDRSRQNLGLETLDVYFIHNPEVQLRFVERNEFTRRLCTAFEALERAVADGRIAHYGTATWDGYRNGLLSLREIESIAQQVAGNRHHFRFVQLPLNRDLPEARTQRVDPKAGTVLEVAEELGITVIASASLGRAVDESPNQVPASPVRTRVQEAVDFVRLTPGIGTALVGMRSVAHVEEILASEPARLSR